MRYLLRDIDDALWARVKSRATSEGRTLRGIMLLLLAWYAEHGMPEGRWRETRQK